MGTNTMQMLSVATKAGTAICCAPVRIVSRSGMPSGSRRLMFSISTVASSTRMPTASASPPSVMMLSVWPSKLSTTSEVNIERGIETATTRVLRQLPRNIRINAAVNNAAITASRSTPVNRRAHEDRLIPGQRNIHALRQRGGDFGKRVAHFADHVQRRSRPVLQHHLQHAALPVAPRDVDLKAGAVVHVSDVAQINHRAVHHFDGNVVQFVHRFGRAVQLDVVFAVADLRRALRLNYILCVYRSDHVGPGNTPLQQFLRVQVNGDHALPAPIGPRKFDAGDGRQPRPQKVLGHVGQLLFGKALAAQPDLQNGNVCSIVRKHERRGGAHGHAANGRGRYRAYFGDIAIEVRFRLKEHLDHRDAMVGLRFVMIHVLDRVRHVPLHHAREAVLHVLRGKSRVAQDDADYGNVDGGKMSTGVCTMATPLRIRIKTDTTMNVYGRLRATLTIHIG